MVGDLYYLYQDNGRYFFHAEENLNKVVNDRADVLPDKSVDDYIFNKLEEVRNRRGDVIVYNNDTAEVPDTDSVRLVILPPSVSLPTRSQETDTAGPEVLRIVQWRGDAPRTRRNTLLFLTAKRDEVRNLRSEVRRHLAWDSVVNGVAKLQGLSGDRLSQATANVRSTETSVRAAMVRTYRWALAPVQRDPQKAEYELNQTLIEVNDSGDIINQTLSKLIEEETLVEYIMPAVLTSMLQQYAWNRRDTSHHVGIDYLWDLLTNNVYLHRLQDKSVLMDCILRGVEQGSFGYARDHDGEKYNNLRYYESLADAESVIAERNLGFLVNPDVAAQQKDEEQREVPEDDGRGSTPPVGKAESEPAREKESPIPPPLPTGPRLITASKTTGANLSLDDINNLREEIIRNLSQDGGEITVEITISARKPGGFSEGVARSVRENSFQLGLEFTESDD